MNAKPEGLSKNSTSAGSPSRPALRSLQLRNVERATPRPSANSRSETRKLRARSNSASDSVASSRSHALRLTLGTATATMVSSTCMALSPVLGSRTLRTTNRAMLRQSSRLSDYCQVDEVTTKPIERSLDRSLSVDFVHRCDKDIGGFTDARDTLDTRDTLDWRSVSGQLAQDDAKTQDHP